LKVSYLCLGLLSKKHTENTILLPPRLDKAFLFAEKVTVKPLKHDQIEKLYREILDFPQAEVLVKA